MASFLVQFSYTEQGLKGLLKEGGSKRLEVVEQLIESAGGKLLAFYYSFGDYDGFAIAEFGDNVDVTTVAVVVGASGAVTTKTTVLLTPEEVDQAVQKSAKYRPPGQ